MKWLVSNQIMSNHVPSNDKMQLSIKLPKKIICNCNFVINNELLPFPAKHIIRLEKYNSYLLK